jgi:type I restriction enzyme M protein
MLDLIFGKAQNKFEDRAKLCRLVVDLIDAENGSALGVDVKGDAYEGLLEKSARDTGSGAGRYFTPRALIQAMVDSIAPKACETVCDASCGTGGLLFTAYNHIAEHNANLTRDQKGHLKDKALTGVELVQATARACTMNLLLQGIGSEQGVLVKVADTLAADPGERLHVVLANPPFGKKSSTQIEGADAKRSTEKDVIECDDFRATTSKKQLNFVQHVKTLAKVNGRAAAVVPDKVLFEGGAGESIRRKLSHECELHTLLRLPAGLSCAQGVKASVLFFDKKAASQTPWTKMMWICELRTNQHFTLKAHPLKRDGLDEFVRLYKPAKRFDRAPAWAREMDSASGGGPDGRWRACEIDELMARDKASLDSFWLRDPVGGRQRRPAAARRDRAGDRRRPGSGAGAVSPDRERSREGRHAGRRGIPMRDQLHGRRRSP